MVFFNQLGCVIVKKSKCKNARISIKKENEIHLRVPIYYTQKDIEELLNTHQKWIEKNLKKLHTNALKIQNLISLYPDKILYFGEWVRYDLRMDFKYLKTALHEYLSKKTLEFSLKMGLKYQKLSVRKSKTRFGSCSYNNNLNFSFILVFAPYDLIDYVIIHELAHIKHKNHSKSFWSLVGEFCPNFLEKRTRLKENAGIYMKLFENILSSEK